MNKVFLSGYYGEKNTGDDALLLCSLWGCSTFLGSNNICATTLPLPELQKKQAFKPIFRYDETTRNINLLSLYYNALTSNYIVFGGGSVFHSTDKMTRDCDLIDLNRGDRAIAVGVSFGPFRDSAAEMTCKKLLDKFEYIGCRDRESIELIQSLAPHIIAEKTFDLAPILFKTLNLNYIKGDQKPRRGLGLALCNYERYINADKNIEKTRFNKIVTVLNQLSVFDIEEIVLIDFNGHPIFGDSDIHKEIIQQVKCNIPIKHISYHANPIYALNHIANLKGLVGMRLHSAIFGYLTKTPTIIFSYHPKCLGWAEQIGASPNFIIDSTKFEEEELLKCIIDIYSQNYEYPKLEISEAEKLALQNWEGAKCALSL